MKYHQSEEPQFLKNVYIYMYYDVLLTMITIVITYNVVLLVIV